MINTKPSQQRLCNACIKYHNLTSGVSKSDISIMIFFALTFFVSTIDEPCSCSADAKAKPHNTVALLALHWKIGFPSPHDLGCAKKKTVFDPTFHQFCYPRNFEHRMYRFAKHTVKSKPIFLGLQQKKLVSMHTFGMNCL